MENNFSLQEMRVLIGRKVKTKVPFSCVPKGTTGEIQTPSRADYTSDGEEVRLLPIKWDLKKGEKPLIDWFDKGEFERFLELIF